MTREQLEHIIRAAAAISNSREIVVVGSQSILGAVPEAPAELRQSMEADIYPLHAPGLADLIDGAIGEGSVVHERYGYYAQGVERRLSTLPVLPERKEQLRLWVRGECERQREERGGGERGDV